MSKLLSFVRRAPKRTRSVLGMSAAAIIISAALFIMPATVLAWGPERPTYTIEVPADHITFNSITNNPNLGDERNFVGIRETGTTNLWFDNMTVEKGKEYTVRMYVHNNAASNLNLVAENVTAKFNLPTTTAKSIQVDGFLDASNAIPTEVYDSATFTSSEDFNLAYVSGSLKLENNSFGASSVVLPESIFTSTGALLGYDKLDGKIPGCFQYAGYVTFNVKPQFAVVALTPTPITVKVDGTPVVFDQLPITVNNRTLVPLRTISEALGAQVSWDAVAQTVTATKDTTTIIVKIGNTQATVNGETKNLDVPAQIINDRTMVPVRFISESLGAKVDWDENSQTVTISDSGSWGPSRPTFTINKPADHVTFDSITDNPAQGDERNFMQVRGATDSNETYADRISLTPGKEYVVYIYYHNNAASNLNASGTGIANGVYIKAQIPAVVSNGSTGTKAVGYVGARNADPIEVWNDISFTNNSGGDISLRYIPDSATIHNFGKTNGVALSNSIITSGAEIGFDSLDGVIPGCNDYAGYVTFRIKAD
jgi:hypothetical protein